MTQTDINSGIVSGRPRRKATGAQQPKGAATSLPVNQHWCRSLTNCLTGLFVRVS